MLEATKRPQIPWRKKNVMFSFEGLNKVLSFVLYLWLFSCFSCQLFTSLIFWLCLYPLHFVCISGFPHSYLCIFYAFANSAIPSTFLAVIRRVFSITPYNPFMTGSWYSSVSGVFSLSFRVFFSAFALVFSCVAL